MVWMKNSQLSHFSLCSISFLSRSSHLIGSYQFTANTICIHVYTLSCINRDIAGQIFKFLWSFEMKMTIPSEHFLFPYEILFLACELWKENRSFWIELNTFHNIPIGMKSVWYEFENWVEFGDNQSFNQIDWNKLTV